MLTFRLQSKKDFHDVRTYIFVGRTHISTEGGRKCSNRFHEDVPQRKNLRNVNLNEWFIQEIQTE